MAKKNYSRYQNGNNSQQALPERGPGINLNFNCFS